MLYIYIKGLEEKVIHIKLWNYTKDSVSAKHGRLCGFEYDYNFNWTKLYKKNPWNLTEKNTCIKTGCGHYLYGKPFNQRHLMLQSENIQYLKYSKWNWFIIQTFNVYYSLKIKYCCFQWNQQFRKSLLCIGFLHERSRFRNDRFNYSGTGYLQFWPFRVWTQAYKSKLVTNKENILLFVY